MSPRRDAWRSVFELSVSGRPPPLVWGPGPPQTENKNSAPQARNCSQITSKQAGIHAFWPPKQRHNHPHTPSGLTRPTRPVDHPTGPLRPSTPPGPLPWAPLGLGLIRLRAWAPPGPLRFLVFVFSRPPSALEALGRPLTEISKTLRPAVSRRSTVAPRPGARDILDPALAGL